MNTFKIKNQIWGFSLKSRRQGNTGPVFLDYIKQQPKHGPGTTFWYAAVFISSLESVMVFGPTCA